MDLLLIRHGLPLHVVTQDGTPADPELAPDGHQQARAVGDLLAAEGVDRIYASPMRRAYQTAEPLAQRLGHEIEVAEGVAEYDRQADTYIPLEQLKREDYDRWLSMMRSGWMSEHVDPQEFQSRVVDTLDNIIADNKGKRVAVFCHGGVINVWAAKVLRSSMYLFFEPRYTSVHRFQAASPKLKSLVSLNEAHHLVGL